MPGSRFTPGEIHALQLAVAQGAKQRDVAREHGFSPSNFQRWFRKYGRPVVRYEPTDADRVRAARWRDASSLADAWTTFRDFAKDGPWADDAELPVFDGEADVHERLSFHTREDARVLLVCEKMSIEKRLDEWEGPGRPSVVHGTRAALAWTPPLASRWTARTLSAHARSLRVPLAFFGDVDPQAIHAFAAIRAGGREALLRGKGKHLPATWIGLDSRWIEWVCRTNRSDEVPVRMTIRMGWLDQEYWKLVKRIVPDVRRLIGGRAYRMLDAGTKLEADALLWQPFQGEFARRLRLVSRRA